VRHAARLDLYDVVPVVTPGGIDLNGLESQWSGNLAEK
jgi:hypothetical protein